MKTNRSTSKSIDTKVKKYSQSPITDAVYPPEIIDREFSRQGRHYGWGTLHDMRECSRNLEIQNSQLMRENAKLRRKQIKYDCK
jgi:hypothetical protein